MAAETPAKCRFSVVLPAFNEGPNIAVIHRRLVEAASLLDGPVEFIWVNDGSTDGTADALDALAASDGRVRVLHFARNFGHMAALTAGLEAAQATGAVITLDADGQHPPELIPELVARWRAGADIVQTVRRATAGEHPAKRLTSRGFYWLINRLGDIELPEGAADFRLLDREVVDALNNLPERDRFVRGLVHWVGFRMDTLPYDAPPRLGGEPKYNPVRMIAFALSGITSFSNRPLRLAFGLGTVTLLLALAYAAFVLVTWISGGELVRGWTSLLLVTVFLGSIQLLALGILGEYVGRIYTESKGRPVYIVRRQPRSRPESGA